MFWSSGVRIKVLCLFSIILKMKDCFIFTFSLSNKGQSCAINELEKKFQPFVYLHMKSQCYVTHVQIIFVLSVLLFCL